MPLYLVCPPDAFQSTPPRREVTLDLGADHDTARISIHTSPKGGDAMCCRFPCG